MASKLGTSMIRKSQEETKVSWRLEEAENLDPDTTFPTSSPANFSTTFHRQNNLIPVTNNLYREIQDAHTRTMRRNQKPGNSEARSRLAMVAGLCPITRP
jgi:hypothetical protein